MTADGFLQQKQRHPVAMAAALSINIAAVTALMLAKSGYVEIVPPGAIPLINIVDPPPPPPSTEPPKQQPHQPQAQNPWTPQPHEHPTAVDRTEIAGTTDIGGLIGDPGLPPIKF